MLNLYSYQTNEESEKHPPSRRKLKHKFRFDNPGDVDKFNEDEEQEFSKTPKAKGGYMTNHGYTMTTSKSIHRLGVDYKDTNYHGEQNLRCSPYGK